MQKQKELLKEVSISAGADKSPISCTKESSYKKKRPKSLHPPIESYWQLVPVKERPKKPPTFKAMLSQPFKFRGSFKNMWRSQSGIRTLEGTRNPKDEKLVDSFRELLFVEGLLPKKQFDYHTLLRLFICLLSFCVAMTT